MIPFIEIANAGVITNAPSVSHIGMNVLNFLLSVMTVIAIIMLAVSGIMYFLAFGDERKLRTAKKSAKYAALGVVVVLSALILVQTLGKFFGA